MIAKSLYRIAMFFLFCCICAELCMSGQETHDHPATHDELSIGWGDQLFEMLCWHSSKDLKVSQHWFVKFLHNDGTRLSYGAMLDSSGAFWYEISDKRYFVNLSAMPMINFKIMSRGSVSLCTQAGLGLNINSGNEKDYFNRSTELAPVLYISPVGIQYVKGPCFASIDLGGMFSMKSKNMIFMLGSRMLSLGIGVRL